MNWKFIIFLSIPSITYLSAQEATVKFPIDGSLYSVVTSKNGNFEGARYIHRTNDYTANSGTLKDTILFELPLHEDTIINALAANALDSFLYAIKMKKGPQGEPGKIVRIDYEGNVTDLTSYFGVLEGAYRGCFDNRGRYWVFHVDGKIRAYDVKKYEIIKEFPIDIRLGNCIPFYDYAYNHKDCNFYFLTDCAAMAFDTSGNIVVVDTPGDGYARPFPGHFMGGLAMGADANLYYYQGNEDSTVLIQYNLETRKNVFLDTLKPGLAPVGSYDMANFSYIGITANIASEFESDTSECLFPKQVSFEDNSDGLIVSWHWDFGDGQTSNLKYPVHHYQSAGRYEVTLIVGTTPNCIDGQLFDTTAVIITLGEKPYNISLPNDTTICKNEELVLFFDTSNVELDYVKWNTGKYLDDSTKFFPICQPQDSIKYFLSVFDKEGCFALDSIKIMTINPELTILQNDTLICEGSSLSVNVIGNTDNYEWNNEATGSPISISDEGVYIVQGNIGNCITQDTVNVHKSLCELYLPNAFSPNNDGYNDQYVIHGLVSLKEFTWSIYDRHGSLLYKDQNRGAFWDGKENGKTKESGIYVISLIGKDNFETPIIIQKNIQLIR